ncbi:LacI family DNA-binding transcriptional regulator [uncultured Mitsuokella sp.]|uniref:LacI family DNA-binding transcriptional regulator n=1 Tax=uncultured Mitsuokella sp. TaxID=453120 RepID=UPI00266EA05B|nr:LacI family DNA-binding transcriptional regulator [uncultured Mitsuokella sp.]
MKINIKKLSELSGFSAATVSNALNGKRGVNHDTAQQILALAREYGYVASSRIQSIRLVMYRNSGEVCSDAPFFSTLIESIENESRKNGYETKLVNLYRQESDYEEQVEDLLSDTSSAMLLIGTELSEEDAKPFLQAQMPLVLLDCAFENLPFQCVLMENENSVAEAVRGLIAKGHRDIGYLHGSVCTRNFTCRANGYRRAMFEHGLPVKDEFQFEMPVSITGAYEAFGRLLEQGAALPTAFFADNDMIALGAMQALQKYKYRVPEDVSMIGFDDIDFSEVCAPGLTTIHVYKKELGQTAVRRLLELIREPEQAKMRIQIYNKLIERGSVAKPRAE